MVRRTVFRCMALFSGEGAIHCTIGDLILTQRAGCNDCSQPSARALSDLAGSRWPERHPPPTVPLPPEGQEGGTKQAPPVLPLHPWGRRAGVRWGFSGRRSNARPRWPGRCEEGDDMQRNNLKDIWASGKPVLVGWCSIGSPFTAEIMAGQGYDTINIDVQHGSSGLCRASCPCCRRCARPVSCPWRGFPGSSRG